MVLMAFDYGGCDYAGKQSMVGVGEWGKWHEVEVGVVRGW